MVFGKEHRCIKNAIGRICVIKSGQFIQSGKQKENFNHVTLISFDTKQGQLKVSIVK